MLYITRLCVNMDYVLSTHRTIACHDMYCVPLMLFAYIVCVRGLLIVYLSRDKVLNTHTHTHTQDKYRNSLCACAPRFDKYSSLFVYV